MLTSGKRRTLWRIQINQIVIVVILLLRVYQVLANIIGRAGVADTLFLIEITVGLIAIIPTLNVIVCTECRTGSYEARQ